MSEWKDKQPEEAWILVGGQEGPSQTFLQPGQLVRSLAGRDKGSYYLVLAQKGRQVWVVDGRKRGIEQPKKKNRRHLQHEGKVAADFARKAAAGEPIRNEEIRNRLNSFLRSPQG